MIKAFVLATALALASVGTANAQDAEPRALETGMDAYNRGEYGEALRWFRMAADQGDASAQYNFGVMYAEGQGVPKNDAEAARWYRMAADQGNAQAQFKLGGMYEDGRGVPQNYTEAMRWSRMAADQGTATAQTLLGSMYGNTFRDVQVVPQNYAEAVRWYRMAADQGNSQGQLSLGYRYLHGEGVPTNYVEAYKTLRTVDIIPRFPVDTKRGDSALREIRPLAHDDTAVVDADAVRSSDADMNRHAKIAAYYANMQMDLSYTAATQRPLVFALFTLFSCIDVFLAGISWSLFSSGTEFSPYFRLLDNLTAFLIAVYLANVTFWAYGHGKSRRLAAMTTPSPSSITDQMALSVSAIVAMIAVNYMTRLIGPGSNLRAPILVLYSLLVLYRLLWNLSHTPLFQSNPGATDNRAVSFLQRVAFVWLCASDVFAWLGPELIALSKLLRESCGQDYFQPYIFIRSATAEEEIDLTNMVAGTPMEGSLRFFASTGKIIVD
jgi:hypothetical protein